jgi:uncharacterized membrane protein
MRLGTGFQALASVSVAASLTSGAWAQQPSITWLGTLPNGARSYAQGVSADGAVVAGYDRGSELTTRASGVNCARFAGRARAVQPRLRRAARTANRWRSRQTAASLSVGRRIQRYVARR